VTLWVYPRLASNRPFSGSPTIHPAWLHRLAG
jgi:hypothetical protein